MNLQQLNHARNRISDLIAVDRDGEKLLIVEVKANNRRRDVARLQLISFLQSEKAISQVIIPYAAIVTLENIELFEWNGDELTLRYCFDTTEVLREYDSEIGKKRIFEYYLGSLVEGWLRDIAYRWKLENPPKLKELDKLGLASRIAEVVPEMVL